MLIEPRQIDRLGNLRLKARSIVEGVINGMHRNPHKGSSVEFAEYKEYSPGDEIKHVDWRAWGRLDRYFVKQFEDETNYRAYLLLDTSGSMDFAFEEAPRKLDHAATLLAAVAWLLLSQGDAPGLLCFDERPGSWLPPASKRTQFEDICRVIEARPATGRTSVEAALSRIAERVHARSMVAIFSDFLDAGDDMLTLARVLRRRGHEVVLFHVLDRAELELPYEGLTLFEGMESDGEALVDPDDVRSRYRELMQAHIARIEHACRVADIEYFRAVTREPAERVILDFVQGRARPRARR
jgi:uncharacterized protein (DUF58 family)